MEMPRPRWPHLHRECTRTGYTYWYVRVRKGKRVRIKAEYGSEAFTNEYRAAIAGDPLPVSTKQTDRKSLRWLYDRYRESPEWEGLSEATRRQRLNILGGVMRNVGNEPYQAFTARNIEAGKERRIRTAMFHFPYPATRYRFCWFYRPNGS